jgi:hypothetical protein
MKFPKKQNGTKAQLMDATEYLFSSQTNKTRLLKALSNADKGENLTEITLDGLKYLITSHQNPSSNRN